MTETCTTQQPTPAPPPARERKYLLTSGITKCGLCGSEMEGKPTRKNTPSYACVLRATEEHEGCARVSMLAAPVDIYIAPKVLAVMAMPQSQLVLQALVTKSTQTGRALNDDIAAVHTKMRDYALAMHEGRMSRPAFEVVDAQCLKELQGLRRQVRKVEAQLGRLQRTQVNLDRMGQHPADKLAAWWQSRRTTMQERHELVRACIEEIRIAPSTRMGYRGFQAERITIVWQPGIIWKDEPAPAAELRP